LEYERSIAEEEPTVAPNFTTAGPQAANAESSAEHEYNAES
jgi:hypothetical protein